MTAAGTRASQTLSTGEEGRAQCSRSMTRDRLRPVGEPAGAVSRPPQSTDGGEARHKERLHQCVTDDPVLVHDMLTSHPAARI